MGAYKAKTPDTVSVWSVLLTELFLHTMVLRDSHSLPWVDELWSHRWQWWQFCVPKLLLLALGDWLLLLSRIELVH